MRRRLTGLLIGISNFVYTLSLGFGLIIPPFWLFDELLGTLIKTFLAVL